MTIKRASQLPFDGQNYVIDLPFGIDVMMLILDKKNLRWSIGNKNMCSRDLNLKPAPICLSPICKEEIILIFGGRLCDKVNNLL